MREYIDAGTRTLFSPFVAAFLISPGGNILDADPRSAAFLHGGGPLDLRHNRLHALDPELHEALTHAIARTADTGMAETLIARAGGLSSTRYAILLHPVPDASRTNALRLGKIACLIFPLGRRRIASARQLMSMFALSAAEARLARSLCHGETLDEYAKAQGVKLPTVKTQLRSVFAKTETDRQATLVSLISGIPPLR